VARLPGEFQGLTHPTVDMLPTSHTLPASSQRMQQTKCLGLFEIPLERLPQEPPSSYGSGRPCPPPGRERQDM